MVMTAGRSTYPVRSAGDGLTPATPFHSRRPVTSTTILADALDVIVLLERRLTARHCSGDDAAIASLGRLETWVRARPWEITPEVVERADRILHTAEHAESTISAACWLESLPTEIFDLLDRRKPGARPEAEGVTSGAPTPHRRASDR